jgi:hypothetical protein
MSPGTIGFFHDWNINQFPEILYDFAFKGLYIWDSQAGNLIYPLDWIFRTILIPFSLLGGDIVSKSLITIFITFSGFSAFLLGKRLGLNSVASIAAGLIYVFSPIIFTRVLSGHSYYLLAYLLVPLVLLTFIRAREENNRVLFIASGLILSLAIVQLQFLIMIPLVLAIFSITDLSNIKKSIIGLGVVLSICFLVTLLPVVLSQIMVKASDISLNPIHLYSGLRFLEHAPASDLLKSFRLLGYEIVPYSYVNLGTSKDFYHVGNNIPQVIFYLDFLLPITGFSALLFRRDRYTIPLALVAIIGLFLLKGSNPPFSEAFSFLFTKGLFIFREMWHTSFLYAFSITFLCAFFIDSIMRLFSLNHLHNLKGTLSRYAKFALPVFLMSIIALANGFPLLKGDFGGYVQTYNMPDSYRALYDIFSENLSSSNTLILPLFSPMRYDGLKLVGIDPFVRYFNDLIMPTAISPGFIPSGTSAISAWILSLMHNNYTNNIGGILSGLGIKYIILRKDFTSNFANFTYADPHIRSKWQESLDGFLSAQKDLVLIQNNNNFKIFKNKVESSKLFIPSRYAAGLSDFNQLLLLGNSSLADFAIYPSSYPLKNSRYDSGVLYYDTPEEVDFANGNNTSFVELGNYPTSIHAFNGWTTNKDWFAYDHLLASRLNKGLFTTLHEAKTEFTLPSSIYSSKSTEIYLKALRWIKGGTVVVNINGVNSYLDLYSLDRKFGIFKIFDDKLSSHFPIRISISNVDGANYLEGLYIRDKHYDSSGITTTNPNDDIASKKEPLIGIEDYKYQDNDGIDDLSTCQTSFECALDLTTGWKDNSSFRVSTTEKTRDSTWPWIYGNMISVRPGQQYELVSHMKLSEYVIQSHIVLQGYNALSQTWYTITSCPTGTNGPLEWSMFSCQITIPKDTTKIRFILNAGWSSSPQHKAITWYDGIYLLNKSDESPAFYRNVSNLQSSLESNQIPQADAKGITNISSNIKEFRKINPTLWHVDLNTTGPLTLAFAEPYDEGWLAEIYANGQIIDTVRSKPLYGSINSFNINRISPDPQVMRGGDKEGTAEINDNIHVVLRYELQYWFEIGLIISAITVVASCTMIIVSATRNRKKSSSPYENVSK